MLKPDAQEATNVATIVLNELLALSPTSGRSGSDLRTSVGDFLANAMRLIQADLSGPPLDVIFQKAITCGLTQPSCATIRRIADGITTRTLGATLMKTALMELTMSAECQVILDTTFISRNQVQAVLDGLNTEFAPLIETVADQMDQMSFQALIALNAAIISYLVETEHPLPRMLNFQFGLPLPTLVQAYKLYADASRADEIRAENEVVHPLFAPRLGVALSQ